MEKNIPKNFKFIPISDENFATPTPTPTLTPTDSKFKFVPISDKNFETTTPEPLPKEPGILSKGLGLLKSGVNLIGKTNPFVPGNIFEGATDQALQMGVDKTINTDIGKKIVGEVSEKTDDLPLKAYSTIQAIGPKTYDEAYGKWKEAKADPEKSVWKDFLYNLQGTGGQSLIGVAMSFIPYAGKPMSAAYWSALSADEQIQERGNVESVGNIGIDVAGDMILGNSLEGLFKSGIKTLKKTILKSGIIEGSTEALQSLLKYGNDYTNAKTPEEKQRIIGAAKNYITSGDILMEIAVGATAGALIGGAGYGASKITGQPTNVTAVNQSLPPIVEKDLSIETLPTLPTTIQKQEPVIEKPPVTPEPVIEKPPVTPEPEPVIEKGVTGRSVGEAIKANDRSVRIDDSINSKVQGVIDGIEADSFTKENMQEFKDTMNSFKYIDETTNQTIKRLENIKSQIEADNFTRENIDDLITFIRKTEKGVVDDIKPTTLQQIKQKTTTTKLPAKPEPITKPKSTLTIKPEIQEKGTPKVTKIEGEKVARPVQLVTKTQAKGMVKSLGGDVTFKYDGTHLTYKDGDKTNISLRPEALGLVASNLKKGQSINIKSEDLKSVGTGFKVVDEKGKTYASKESGNIDSFENQIGDKVKDNKDFKIYEKVNELIKKYAERVGEGYLPKKTVGVFYHDTKNIRLKGMNNLSVAAHEITHYLDLSSNFTTKQLKGDKSPKSRELRKELTKLYVEYYPGGKAKHPLQLRLEEGYATLLQKYTEQPTTITQNYPNVVKEMLTPNGLYYKPVIGEILFDLKEIVKDYQRLDSLDKVGAHLTSDLNPTGKKSFLSKSEWVRTEMADQIFPMEKLDEKANNIDTEKSLSLWLRLYKGYLGSIIGNNIMSNKGYYTFTGIKSGVKQTLPYNWKTLMKTLKQKQMSDQFDRYIVSRDQHFNFIELDNLQKEMEQITENILEIGKEAATLISGPDGKTMMEEFQEAKENYENLKIQLKNNGFSREVVTEAYEMNKDKFEKEAEMYDALIWEDIKFGSRTGLISDYEYKKMSGKRGKYGSMRRQFYDDIIGDSQSYGNTGMGKKPSSLKGRKGSSRAIVSPIASSIRNHGEILRKGFKQLTDNLMVNIALTNTMPDLFQRQQLKRYKDPETGAWIYPQENDPNIIMSKGGGKRVPILVDSQIKKIYDEIISFEDMHLFEKMLSATSRFFNKGTTGLYLGFTATNFTIDQITATSQTRNNYKPVYSGIKNVYKALSDSNDPRADYLKEYMVLVGDRQTLVGWDSLSAKEQVNVALKERDKLQRVADAITDGVPITDLPKWVPGVRGKTLKTPSIATLAAPQKYSEIFTRASEYAEARLAGKPQIVALEDAGRVTAPFHHFGRWGGKTFGKVLIKSIPYLNAQLQVTEQIYRSSFKSGRKASLRMLFTLTAITAAQITAFATVLRLATDDQEEQYKDLSPGELNKYMWVPDPDGKGLIKIRFPDALNIYGSMINMYLADKFLGTKYTTKDYVDVSTSVLPTQFNPTDIEQAFYSWVPQLAKPSLQLITNTKDFPSIRPLESQSQLAKEPELRYTDSTSVMAKKLGDMLGWSPIKIDHFITQSFGRTSGYITGKPGIYNPLSSMTKEYYFESGRRLQEYYNIKTENDQKYNSFNNRLREFTPEETSDLLKERAKIKVVTGLLNTYNEIKNLNPEATTKLRASILTNIEKL